MMKKVHDAFERKRYVLAITLAFVMLASSAAIAQIQDKSGNLMLDTDEVMKTGSTDVVPGIMQLSGDFEVRRPIGELFGRTSWPNPDVNFLPNGERIPAGDLNGDGSNDLIMHFAGKPDPRDSDPTTVADRTLVYLSGSELDQPDYIFYEILYPAGDLNGDGKSSLISRDIFGSPSLYTLGDSGFDAVPLTLEHDLPSGQFINAFLINNDLDGSGFMDMIFTITTSAYPDGARQFYVLSGAASESGFDLRTYDFADLIPSGVRPMTTPRVFDTFSHDGGVYLVASARTSFPWEHYSVILAIDGEKNVDFIQALQFEEISITAAHPTFSARFEPDGPPYLVMSSESYPNQKAFFHPLSPVEELLFSEEPVALHDLQVWPAGDIGNDGTMKFIARETTDGPLRLAEVASTTTGGLSFLDELPGQNTGNTYVMPRFQIYWYGDLTGNGTDDHIIEYTNAADALTGYMRISGGSANAGFESKTLDLEQYGPRVAYDVYAVGDVTGNGFDDFVIYYLNSPLSNTLAFHQGGSNWDSPAFTWTLETGTAVIDVVGGRFLDAERRDLVILTSDRPDPLVNFAESILAIYQGGGIPSGSALRSVKKEDVYPGISPTLSNVIAVISNAGDVNNSGLDDLLVATAMVSDPSMGPLPAVLYYGGSGFLAGAPDASMGFPVEDLGFGIGGTLAGLGDINGDGIDDFAIANISQGGTSDLQKFGVNGGGRVHVYFGSDGATEFSDPDITLRADTVSMASGNDMWVFGMSQIASGDFNGNGLRGIAVNPFVHRVRTNQAEGVPGVHIFNGEVTGTQPDQLLPLHAGIMGLTTPEYPFLAVSSRMEMQGIPDLTSNGRDELLIIGGLSSTNAVLHYGRDRFSDMPDIVFEAPNSAFTMGAAGSFINRQFRAAIGDFNGDGKLNFLVVQRDDRNLPDTPVYMYELGRPGGVQVKVTKTEPIGSTGGTIEDEETGTKVVIPADATEDEIEIEVGTFTVVPEGAEVSGVMIYLGPPGTTFSEPVEITVSYDPDNLPDGVENEEDLVLLRYDESTSEWEELPSVVNTTDKTVTGTTTRFSGFGAGAIKSAVNIEREEVQLPAQVQLHQNYPNPFNPLTVIGFTLPADSEVRLEVYNILGERVAVLADERRTAGTHQVSFNASRLSSGVYLYRLTTGDRVQTRKMMLIK